MMQELFELVRSLNEEPDFKLNENTRFIDTDTIVTSEGQRGRIAGINAREVPKYDDRTGEFEPGQEGGMAQTLIGKAVAERQGFDQPIFKEQKDVGGTRQLADIGSKKGLLYSDYMLREGLASTTPYSTAEQVQTAAVGGLKRAMREREAPVNRFEMAREGLYSYENEGDFFNDLLQQFNPKEVVSKPVATNAREYGLAPEWFSKPAYIPAGEDIMGYATSNWDAGREIDRANFAKAAYNVVDMFAPKGSDVETWARNNIYNVGQRLENASMGRDTSLFDPETGKLQLDTFGKAWNNLVWTAASNVSSIGLAVVGSLHPTLLALPFMQNAGRIWGEQPENDKDHGWALGAAAGVTLFDQLGLKGVLKGFGSKALNVGDKEVQETIVTLLMKQKGLTRELAEKQLEAELGSVAKQIGIVLKAMGGAAVKEGSTEAIQKVIEDAGASKGQSLNLSDLTSSKNIYELANEAYGGAIMGGTMAAPTGLMDNKQRRYEIARELGIPIQKQDKLSAFVESIKPEFTKTAADGTVFQKDVLDIAEEAEQTTGPVSLEDLHKGEKITLGSELLSLVQKPLTWFRDYRNKTLAPYIHNEFAQRIAALVGSDWVRGAVAGLAPTQMYLKFATSWENQIARAFQEHSVNKADNDIITNAVSTGTLSSLPPHLQNLRAALQKIQDDLQSVVQTDFQTPASANFANLLNSPDFFLKARLPSPELIRKNKALFTQLLKKYGSVVYDINGNKRLMNEQEASIFTNELSKEISFKNLEKLIESGVFENDKFNEFLDNNVLSNAGRILNNMSKSLVRNKVFGDKNSNIAKLIQKGIDLKQITPDEGKKLAQALQKYLDAFDHDLNKYQSPLVNGIMENMNFAATLIYMDTAAFANLSELAYSAIGLADQKKYYKELVKTIGKQMFDTIKGVGYSMARKQKPLTEQENFLQEKGYLGMNNDLLYMEGSPITSRLKASFTKMFFKLNGIQGIANAARFVRGSIAADELKNLISMAVESKSVDDRIWAKDRLNFYRIDSDWYTKTLSDYDNDYEAVLDPSIVIKPNQSSMERQQEILRFMTMTEDAIINIIDEFAVRPEPGATPIVFDDHRFALFTQFKRFSAHMTAHVIPQLWRMYIKRGNPQYTYGTFANLMMAYGVAYLGLTLKELIRGDDDDDEGKKMITALQYSWAGTLPDIWELGRKVYKTASGGSSPSQAAKDILSQSPGANTTYSMLKDIAGVGSSDEVKSDKALEKLVKKIPFAGEFQPLREEFSTERK